MSILDVITAASDFAIVGSLLVLAYEIYYQRKEMKYSIYEKLMSDYSATAALLLDHPDVLDVSVRGDGKPKNWDKYTEAEKKAYCYFDCLLDLLERKYFAVKDVRLPKKDWADLDKWIEDLVSNSIFLDVFNDAKKIYDSEFAQEIEKIINKRHPTAPQVVGPSKA